MPKKYALKTDKVDKKVVMPSVQQYNLPKGYTLRQDNKKQVARTDQYNLPKGYTLRQEKNKGVAVKEGLKLPDGYRAVKEPKKEVAARNELRLPDGYKPFDKKEPEVIQKGLNLRRESLRLPEGYRPTPKEVKTPTIERQPLRDFQLRAKEKETSVGAPKGINLLTAPELTDESFAQNIENYLIDGGGVLKKREGITEIFDIAGTDGISMLEKFTDRFWIFAAGDTVYSYDTVADSTASIKTYTTSDPFDGVKFGDYFYFCNGSDEIDYVTFDFGSELISSWDHQINVVDSQNLYVTYGTTSVVFQGNGVSEASQTLSVTPGKKYKVNVSYSAGTGTSDARVFGPFPTWNLSDDGNISNQILVCDSTSDFTLRRLSSTYTKTLEATHTPTGTIDGVNKVFTLNRTDYVDDFTINIDGAGASTGHTIEKNTLTLTTAPTTSLTFRGSSLDGSSCSMSSFSVKEQLTDTIVLGSLSTSPYAKQIFIKDGRMYAGQILGDSERLSASEVWDGEFNNVPFSTWTTGTSPESGFELSGDGLGDIQDITELGSQIVVFYEDGKKGIRPTIVDSASGLALSVVTDFKVDGGAYRARLTPYGIFYISDSGLWQMLSGGNTNQPYSAQEAKVSRILGESFVAGLDFSNGDIIHDFQRNLILVTCKAVSNNDTVLWYNIENQSFGKITGWGLNRFMRDGDELYGGSSTTGKVFKLFDGNDDDGSNITSEFKQEVNLGIGGLFELTSTLIKGFIADTSNVDVDFDIYDKNGKLVSDKLTLDLASYTGNSVVDGMRETRAFTKKPINEFERIIVKVSSDDKAPHKLTYFQLETVAKGTNTEAQQLT